MAVLPRSVEKVIEEFERLPGVGPKSAARMAYFLLRAPKERSRNLSEALVDMKSNTVTCASCFNVADATPCRICDDPARDPFQICIVEEPLDVVALERSGVFEGKYFVLGGVISPADGIGPEQLRMKELRSRVKSEMDQLSKKVEDSSGDDETDTFEIVIATNPNLEGEATASYIAQMVHEIEDEVSVSVDISRLAMGLPTGADLEYADRLTLKRAMEGRTRVE